MSEQEETFAALSQARILLVEDNEINQLVIKEILHGKNINIEVAENGAEAVERVQQQPFDVILMDLQMPVMDGYEATRRIREIPYAKHYRDNGGCDGRCRGSGARGRDGFLRHEAAV